MNAFADGLEEGGAEVERIDLKKLDLRHCIGCYSCFFKTPGACILDDDMSRSLYGKFVSSDLAVLSSPLYFYHVNGPMKTFIDRTHPFLLNPLEASRFDHSSLDHGLLHGYRGRHPKIVAISCGQSYVQDVFRVVSDFFRYIYRDNLVAEFYKCESVLVGHHGNFKRAKSAALSLLKEAGRHLAGEGAVPEALMAEFNRPLESMDVALDSTRLVFDTCLAKRFSMTEFIQSNQKWLYPSDVEHFLKLMQLNFNEANAASARMSIQFVFEGPAERSGACWFRIEGGRMESAQGRMEGASVLVRTSLSDWTDVMHGRLSLREAVKNKTLSANGDLLALMTIAELFAGKQYE